MNFKLFWRLWAKKSMLHAHIKILYDSCYTILFPYEWMPHSEIENSAPELRGAPCSLLPIMLLHRNTSPDETYITALSSLHDSMKHESLASFTWSVIDSVRRVKDLYCGVDPEALNQSIQHIDSVVRKIASLCKSKQHMQSMFNEVSHIAKVSTGIRWPVTGMPI